MANQIKWQDKIEFCVGDTIKVSQTVKDGDKTRTQAFQGIVIAIRGDGQGKNFIVRKIAVGSIGVEKIYPINTPTVTGIEIIKKGKVRRAKLYHLRNLLGKKATKIKDVFVRKGQAATVEVPVKTSETETKGERVESDAIKVRSGPKVGVVTVKRVKKGPGKVVRAGRPGVG